MQREIGEHSARLEAVEEDIKEMRADLRSLLEIAQLGKGVGWFLIKLGALTTGALFFLSYWNTTVYPWLHRVLGQ